MGSVFIEGTVICVARPPGYVVQLVPYNWKNRKHALKFQAINKPDSLMPHAYGAMEIRIH